MLSRKKLQGNKKNKKGQFFDLGLAFVVVIILGFVLFKIYTDGREAVALRGVSALKMVNLQQEAREQEFFLQSSAEFASQQAFYEILQDLKIISGEKPEDCKSNDKVSVLWNSICKPKEDRIKQVFEDKFKDEFVKHIQTYKSTYLALEDEKDDQGKKTQPEAFSNILTELKKENIEANLEGSSLKVKINKPLVYSNFFNYTVKPELEVKLKIDPKIIVKINDEFNSIVKSCRDNTEFKNKKDCLEIYSGLAYEKFRDDFEKIENTNIIDSSSLSLKTKRLFFYTQEDELKFEKIEMKFGFE